ncbi:MAG: APC family permease [Verrucomicrobia bacterium]|nr:APC family permease [Verrucomicrobiota bacterium]
MTVMQLLTATYFMVAGGPFGLEEVIHGAGYLGAALILIVTPIVWSLPTALMVAELSAAMPEDGGYYTWVKRAMGRFWGFQEAWLSLAASIFDMAIYPTLFVLYLSRLFPSLGAGAAAIAVGFAMIAACAALNLGGARSVGGSSVVLSVLLLAPFAVIVLLAAPKSLMAAVPTERLPLTQGGLFSCFLVAMWNCMGWDNASTVAGEVERPHRTYPLAMMGAVALLAATYVVPVLAVSRLGVPPSSWTTGSWADVAGAVGGRWLMITVVVAGMISAFGMLNALVLSYTRVPVALAEDGFLPKVFALRIAKNDAPWVAILVCAACWALCLGIGFERLVALDIMLYGLSLLLEFVALVVLRVREPDLPRPYRVPGGLLGAVGLGVFPALILGVALWSARGDRVGPVSALAFGAGVVLLGAVVYAVGGLFRRRLDG